MLQFMGSQRVGHYLASETQQQRGVKRTLVHCLWEGTLMQPLWKTVWKVFKKLRIKLPYDPAILLLSRHEFAQTLGASEGQ